MRHSASFSQGLVIPSVLASDLHPQMAQPSHRDPSPSTAQDDELHLTWNRRTKHSGFMMADAIVGLALLGALATMLAVAAGMRQKSARRLSDQRHAQVLAEQALANLQSSGEATISDASAQVSVDRTGKLEANREWVEVKVVSEGRHASIVGLAPTTQPGVSP